MGTLAFAAIVTTMTVGRFTVNRVAHRFGAVRVLRFGTLLATVGLVTVMLSPVVPVTIAGWAILGLGLQGVPQVFSAAGNIDAAGRSLALVVGSAYVAVLVGPGFRLVRRRDIAEHRAGLAAVRTSRVRLLGVERGTTAQRPRGRAITWVSQVLSSRTGGASILVAVLAPPVNPLRLGPPFTRAVRRC